MFASNVGIPGRESKHEQFIPETREIVSTNKLGKLSHKYHRFVPQNFGCTVHQCNTVLTFFPFLCDFAEEVRNKHAHVFSIPKFKLCDVSSTDFNFQKDGNRIKRKKKSLLNRRDAHLQQEVFPLVFHSW